MTAVVGFDVGGTHIRALAAWSSAIGLECGPLVRRRWRPSEGLPTLESLAAALLSVGAEARAAAGVDGFRAAGVGIAGQLDVRARSVVNAPNLGWRDAALAERLESTLRVPVALVNDVNAILLGEAAFGVARGARDVVAVYAGTGIGGALMCNGQLVSGASGTAGEIGHVKLLGYAGACGCGERGCLEALAGGVALERQLRSDAVLGPLLGSGATVADADRLARDGQPDATAFWDRVADALAHVVAGVCTLTNPELLVLGGGVFDNAPSLRQRVEVRTIALTLTASRPALRVADGALGERAGALGSAAAALALD